MGEHSRYDILTSVAAAAAGLLLAGAATRYMTPKIYAADLLAHAWGRPENRHMVYHRRFCVCRRCKDWRAEGRRLKRWWRGMSDDVRAACRREMAKL